MDHLQERISYIEGLAEGLDLYSNKREGKFYGELINILSDMSRTIESLSNRLSELEEYVEAIDEDLNDLEWEYYEDEEDDDLDYDDDEDDDETDYVEYVLDDNQSDGYYEVICPNCHELLMVEHEMFEEENVDEVVCPNCQEVLIIDSLEDTNGEEVFQS